MKLFVLLLLGLLFSISCQEIRRKSNLLVEKEKIKNAYPVHYMTREVRSVEIEAKEKEYSHERMIFKAKETKNGVLIYWSIKENSKIKTFVIEKSLDNSNFESITKIEDDMEGILKHYSYVDHFPSSKIIYYRLKQLYKDGTSVLTNSFKVELKNTIDAWMFIAKKATNLPSLEIEFNLKPNQYPVEIDLYNVLGTRIATQKEHQQQFQLSLPDVLEEGGTIRARTADQKVLVERF